MLKTYKGPNTLGDNALQQRNAAVGTKVDTSSSKLVQVSSRLGKLSKFIPGSVPSHYWHDFSPYTESYEDIDEDDFFETTSSTGPPEPLPYFLDGSASNVTAQLGGRVLLHCRVGQLGDKTISWVRRRGEELVLLSAGGLTLASDGRWSLQAASHGDWRLALSPVAARDHGPYECQVSTHPPLVRTVHLSVLVPKVEIVDERGVSVSDKFYKEGSIIELRCVISKVPQPSGQVVWTHAGKHLNYETKRGGISVKTEVLNSGALSRLYIANAARKDSGNYTCALEDVSATTVSVHVLKGENPLAMQRGRGHRQTQSKLFIIS
ncbi:opioid-binding protein/cell adhesion molecule-like [Arctopsyche grandis]|uniref:opioid-binding protein/cell adhesion molecule-like n=1 Tax=Arctopsyche grandis TaxID=121162 RepID=UPI00406D6AF1